VRPQVTGVGKETRTVKRTGTETAKRTAKRTETETGTETGKRTGSEETEGSVVARRPRSPRR